MTMQERVTQALQGLSEAALVRVLAYIKTEAEQTAPSGELFSQFTPEQRKAYDDAMTELIGLSQEMGGYTIEGSRFPR